MLFEYLFFAGKRQILVLHPYTETNIHVRIIIETIQKRKLQQ